MSLDWILLGLRLLTTAILYLFLGLAFYIIWRDLNGAAAQAFDPSRHRLRVIDPADDPGLAAGDILFLQPITQLGRDVDNTIVLNDTAASGKHAALRQENGVWWLEDLGSRNGTLLNDLPLKRPTTLTHGDIIEIGKTRFQLETVANHETIDRE